MNLAQAQLQQPHNKGALNLLRDWPSILDQLSGAFLYEVKAKLSVSCILNLTFRVGRFFLSFY